MLVPEIEPMLTSKQCNTNTYKQWDSIIYNYLFVKEMSYRDIDEKVLGLFPVENRGLQSKEILHSLGFKERHNGIFASYSIDEAIKILEQQDALNFNVIIDSLKRFKLTGKISQVFDSWEQLDYEIALKTVDKSTLVYNVTGVPIGIRSFFDIENLGKNDITRITLNYGGFNYIANIEMDNLRNPRSRLLWKSDFGNLLRETMSNYYDLLVSDCVDEDIELPKIRFKKISKNHFDIGFIYPNEIVDDINEAMFEYERNKTSELTDDFEPNGRKEGKSVYVYGKQYERNSKNRVDAIKYHGTRCSICGFDFEKIYGKRGKGYIEIHHLKPLFTVEKEADVNPRTDLIPVCSNCHKMIHRRRNEVLSIEEMKEIIKIQKLTECKKE